MFLAAFCHLVISPGEPSCKIIIKVFKLLSASIFNITKLYGSMKFSKSLNPLPRDLLTYSTLKIVYKYTYMLRPFKQNMSI